MSTAIATEGHAERTASDGTERSEPNVGGVGAEPPPACLAFVDALPTVLLHADWIARGVMPHKARTLEVADPTQPATDRSEPCLGQAAPAVCREWARPLQHGDAHWRWLCERLAVERGLYLPAGGCPSPKGWQAHFGELWKRRDMWTPVTERAPPPQLQQPQQPQQLQPQPQLQQQQGAPAPQEDADDAEDAEDAEGAEGAEGGPPPPRAVHTFSVSVGARFRPAVATAGGAEEAEGGEEKAVTLTMPLHQRVAMVRAARGCSQAAAMRLVMKERSRAKPTKGGDDGGDGDGCVVAPRRPDEGVVAAQRARQETAAAAHIAAARAGAPAADARAKCQPHLQGGEQGSRGDTQAQAHAMHLPRPAPAPHAPEACVQRHVYSACACACT